MLMESQKYFKETRLIDMHGAEKIESYDPEYVDDAFVVNSENP